MTRLRGVLVGLTIMALFSGLAFAGDKDDEIERILRKYDEKFRQLREEMKQELERLTGGKVEGPRVAGAPWIGIDAEPLKEGLRVLLNLEKGEGLVVLGVADGGPADKAGIRKLDIILEFNGARIGDLDSLKEAIQGLRPGKEVKVLVLRNGERQKVDLVVGGRGGATPNPTPDRPGVGEYLDESLKGRLGKVREHVKALIEGDTEDRMRARRFFEKLLRGSADDQDKVLEQIEGAAEELLGKLPRADREEMRKVFRDMLKGFRHVIQQPKSGKGSQKKEDIEAFLEEMLGGKKPGPAPKPQEKDDIDKLLDELLGKKDGDKKDDVKPADEPGDMPVNIPAEWDKALEDILGKEMWSRLKAMMKSPEYSEMLKQFFPDGFEFTPANVKKLLQQYGIELDQLPDRLREMGVEEEAIEKILELLKRDDVAPAKREKPWMGIRARDTDDSAGVIVTGIEEDGPAGDSGMKEGDIIVQAGGKQIKSKADLKSALQGKYAGDSIKVVVKRGRREVSLDFKLAAKK